jgi:hypothetical protein
MPPADMEAEDRPLFRTHLSLAGMTRPVDTRRYRSGSADMREKKVKKHRLSVWYYKE